MLFAQTSQELRKAEIAGAYWGAVIMASEFKKTECGKGISIGRKWTDVDAATREILSNFPASTQSQIAPYFSKQRERSARVEMYSIWVIVASEKCEGAKKLFWNQFDVAVRAWEAVR